MVHTGDIQRTVKLLPFSLEYYLICILTTAIGARISCLTINFITDGHIDFSSR